MGVTPLIRKGRAAVADVATNRHNMLCDVRTIHARGVTKGVTLIIPRVTPGRYPGDTTAARCLEWPRAVSPFASGVTLVSPCFSDRVTSENTHSRSGFSDVVSPVSPSLYEKRENRKDGQERGAAAVVVRKSGKKGV
jgi:hypothetical protein